MLGFCLSNSLAGADDIMKRRLMERSHHFRKGQAVGRSLCDLAIVVTVIAVGSANIVRRTTVVVSIIEFVDGFVMAIHVDCRFALVTIYGRTILAMLLLQFVALGEFGHTAETVLFLEGTRAALAVTTAASMHRRMRGVFGSGL